MTTETLILRPEYAPQKGQSTGSAPPAGAGSQPAAGPSGPTGEGSTGTPNDPNTPPQNSGDACMQQLPFILIMVGVFYFLLIRPQQKQEKARKELVAALKKGDQVVTNSGLHGVVASLTDETVTIRVDKDVKLMFDRSAIQRGAASGEKAIEKKAE